MCCFARLPSLGAIDDASLNVAFMLVCPSNCTTRMDWQCRQPARYASVCSHWNDLLAGNSEVWKDCVLSSTYTVQRRGELVDVGTMLNWLVRRCTSIESITFRKYKVGSSGNGAL
jgi:hypothetical protein